PAPTRLPRSTFQLASRPATLKPSSARSSAASVPTATTVRGIRRFSALTTCTRRGASAAGRESARPPVHAAADKHSPITNALARRTLPAPSGPESSYPRKAGSAGAARRGHPAAASGLGGASALAVGTHLQRGDDLGHVLLLESDLHGARDVLGGAHLPGQRDAAVRRVDADV